MEDGKYYLLDDNGIIEDTKACDGFMEAKEELKKFRNEMGAIPEGYNVYIVKNHGTYNNYMFRNERYENNGNNLPVRD
jgi:hypothetical protein